MDLALPVPAPALRWTVQAVLSGILFAGGYLYGCVAPLAKVLATQLGFSNMDIGLLQAMSSLPDLGMVLVGGIIIDRIGTRRSAFLFSNICLGGAVLTALSPRLGVMAAGRFVYGLGAGSLSVAVSTMIAKWFRGPRLGFSYGLILTFHRIGALAAQTGPAWAGWAYAHWRTPLLLAVAVAAASLAGAGIYGMLESRTGAPCGPDPGRGEAAGFSWRGQCRFGPSYWLVILLSVTYFAGILPFQTFAQKFFIEAHRLSPARASMLAGIPIFIAMAASPLGGLLADRIGRRALLMAAGTALLAPVYLMLGYGRTGLVLPMVMMGVSFALVPTILYPAVMLIVPAERMGKAMALMQWVLSMGLLGFNFLIGWSNDAAGAGEANPGGYRPGMWLFSASILAALGLAVALWRRETGPRGHGLENAKGDRHVPES
jgi:MFS family permease